MEVLAWIIYTPCRPVLSEQPIHACLYLVLNTIKIVVRYRHRLRGGNISEATPTNSIRSKCKFYNVLRSCMGQITDDTLVLVFRSDFLRPEATIHDELLCERAFLLLKTDCSGKAEKLAGVDMQAALLDTESTRRILREKYGFSQLDLYKLTATVTV